MDIELKKLCKEIYLQNKDVIDMIYSVGNEIDIELAITAFKSKYSDIVPVSIKNRTFVFGIESFAKGRIDDPDSWGGGFPVCFWFSEYYGKLKLIFEVGPFNDANKRIDFLKKLEAFGVKISERAKEPGRKYTRIYTKTHSIKDWTDYEEIAEEMEQMYEKEDVVTMRQSVANVIDHFNW